MRFGKLFGVMLMVGVLASPAPSWSTGVKFKDAKGKMISLQTGMPLKTAIETLKVPDKIIVKRGLDSDLDSIEINYSQQHNLLIRALSGGTTVEAIEIQPGFKGEFLPPDGKKTKSNLKLDEKFEKIVNIYGVPKSIASQVVSYPNMGIYFMLSQDSLLRAKLFSKDSKLLEHELIKP